MIISLILQLFPCHGEAVNIVHFILICCYVVVHDGVQALLLSFVFQTIAEQANYKLAINSEAYSIDIFARQGCKQSHYWIYL